MAEILTYSLVFGITGFLIACVLTHPGEALAWWPAVVQWATRTGKKSPAGWNAFQWWVSKITYLCAKCIAGNLGVLFAVLGEAWSGLAAVPLSIFIAWALEKHYNGQG